MNVGRAENAVVIIAPDEKSGGSANAGGRDYVFALLDRLRESGLQEDTDYLIFKLPPVQKEKTAEALARGGDPRALPIDNGDYERLPVYTPARALAALSDARQVQVIGAFNTTVDVLNEMTLLLRKQGKDVVASHITHKVDTAVDLAKLVEVDAIIFATQSPAALKAVDARLAALARLVELEAVPHTNLPDSCLGHYDIYAAVGRGDAVLKREEPFAVAILNAGFEIDGCFAPYLAREAEIHGRHLGQHLAQGTHLFLGDGSPRSVRNRHPNPGDTHAPEDAMAAFVKGYRAAQPEALIVQEPYKEAYNFVKVAYVLGQRDDCVAWISNNEGYGTKAAALTCIDNQSRLLGAFPFRAEKDDSVVAENGTVTYPRLEREEEYSRLGVARLLPAEGGGLIVRRHPAQQKTPLRIEDGAVCVIRALGLDGVKKSLAPKQVPPGLV